MNGLRANWPHGSNFDSDNNIVISASTDGLDFLSPSPEVIEVSSKCPVCLPTNEARELLFISSMCNTYKWKFSQIGSNDANWKVFPALHRAVYLIKGLDVLLYIVKTKGKIFPLSDERSLSSVQ